MINNFIKKCAQSKLSSICDELLDTSKQAMTVNNALSASVIAGGDDRDRGPVESLDAIASPTQTTSNKATSNKATIILYM
jgi:hypothetical protein